MRTRIFSFATVVLLFAVLVMAGCGGGGASPQPAGTPSPTDTNNGSDRQPSEQTQPTAETIVLKVADSFPPTHYQVVYGLTPWMEAITERSGGRIQFEYYGAEQLGKLSDMLTLVQRQTTHIAYVPPNFYTGQLPYSGLHALPGLFSTSMGGSQAFHEFSTNNPLVVETDYLNNDIRLMWASMTPTYNPYMVDKPIRTVDDMRGRTIRGAGKYQGLALEALGATQISIATPEVYQSLAQGTVEGALYPSTSIQPYRLEEIVKSVTLGFDLSAFYASYAINEEIWQSLPADIQEIFLEESESAMLRVAEYLDEENERLKTAFADFGMEIIQLPPEEKAKADQLLAPVLLECVTEMDELGLSGQRALDDFRDIVKKYEP